MLFCELLNTVTIVEKLRDSALCKFVININNDIANLQQFTCRILTVATRSISTQQAVLNLKCLVGYHLSHDKHVREYNTLQRLLMSINTHAHALSLLEKLNNSACILCN